MKIGSLANPTIAIATVALLVAVAAGLVTAKGALASQAPTTSVFERNPANDFDTLDAAGNNRPTGVWSDGTTMWVSDGYHNATSGDNKIYAYDMATKVRVPTKDFDTLSAAGNVYATGIWSDGTTMWVADNVDGYGEKIYAYDMTTKARVPAKDFNTLEAARNDHPKGIWSDSATMWVVDDVDDRIYAYDMATKARVPTKDFDTLAAVGNYNAHGIWSDGTTMWVADAFRYKCSGFPWPWTIARYCFAGKIYAYDMVTRARVAAMEFDTLSAAGNGWPTGIWSAGAAMWVADGTDDKIYVYNMPQGSGFPGTATVSDFARNPANDFALEDGSVGPSGIWSDRVTMWVADESDAKIYAYDMSTMARDSSKDFDTLDSAGNDNPQGIWSDGTTMLVSDSFDDKIYAYNMSTRAWDSSKDFDTLDSAGNDNPQGIWSDRETMWVADESDAKIYAYDMTTKARVAGREFDTLENESPIGIWSDRATMWVADESDARIYAYDMATRARVAAREFNTLGDGGNDNPSGIWSDGITMWVADDGDAKIYAYDMETKARVAAREFDTLRATGNFAPQDLWSDGITMWVANIGVSAKIYSYDAATKARVPAWEFDTLSAAGNDSPTGIWSDGMTMWVVDDGDERIYAYNAPQASRVPVRQTTPGEPTGLTAAANGQTQIDLSWSAPASDGGDPITGYWIEVSADGSAWSDLAADTGSAGTSYSHAGLTAGSTRHYRVSAINSAGTSSASNIATGTTETSSGDQAPDLVVGAPTVSESGPAAGVSFTLTATVRNLGTVASGSTNLRYYRSTDATITTSDTQVGTDPVSGLPAFGMSAQSIDLTAPDIPGTYYYGACVDADSDETITTNNCSSAVKVIVGAEPGNPTTQRYSWQGSTTVVSWDAVASADHYNIYYDDFFSSNCRLSSSGSPISCEELSTNVVGTSYTHTSPDDDEGNYYWVTACNSGGCSDIDSNNPARFIDNTGTIPNVFLRTVRVTPDWIPFASTGGWTAAVPLKESAFLKFYEVAIWEETSSVHLYEFPNDYDPFYGLGAGVTTQQKIAYREQFLIRKYTGMPEAWTDARSEFLKAAFIDITSYLVDRHPGSQHHLMYSGHGGPGGRLFAGLLNYDHAYDFLESWSQSLGRPLGVIDMGGPCNKGSFTDLDNFCEHSKYFVASDLPNGGYTFDDWTIEKYRETNPETQYHNLLSADQTLEEALKGRIDLKRKAYEYSRDYMIENRVAQANYLYSCAAFLKFSPDFESFLDETGVDYLISDDLYQFMVDNNAAPSLIQRFNDIFVHKADNKDFFDWSQVSNGMLMPRSGTAPTVPGPPRNLTAASNGHTQIDLSWSAPASDGGSGITGYRIEVSANGSAWRDLEADTGSTSTRYSHTGLTAGSTRYYRISAINSAGTSSASNIATATTESLEQPTADMCATGGAVSDADNNPGLVSDCEALLAARDTLRGTRTLNWSASTPITSWDGVTLAGVPQRVTRLDLDGSADLNGDRLTGRIPAELGGLTSLGSLGLGNNQLTGPIPAELGGLSNLEQLFLGDNRLIGTIPSELGGLSNLTYLDLFRNQLTGAVPSELSSLSNLEGLHLSDNQLTGAIPSGLGGLSNLEGLFLDSNQLTGAIPSELGDLSNLMDLFLAGNQLTGTIPSELAALSNLEQLFLGDNQLSGAIPSDLGDLSNLQQLWLDDNQLTGTIPPELGSLTNLEGLLLGGNQLSGCIPASLSDIPNPPTGLTATANGTTQINLSWSPPYNEGSSPVTGYRIEVSADGSSWDVLEANTSSIATSYSHTGLTAGSTRHYRVSAVTAAGDGPWSSTAIATTATWGAIRSFSPSSAAPGGKVVVTVAASGYGTFGLIKETLPTGFSYVTSSLDDSEITLVESPQQQEVTFTLLGVTSFTYTVAAPSAAGTYSFSGVLRNSDLEEVPVGGALTISVTARDPVVARYDANNNGMIEKGEVIAAINDYLFGDADEAISKAEVIGLINLYLFGPSAPPTPPWAPEGLTATGNGLTRMELSWSAPPSDGGAAITGYRIEVSESLMSWNDLESDTGSTATTLSHTGLTAGSTRHYRVSAINSVGTGPPSNLAAARTSTTGTDRAALVALYNATDGPNWTNDTNWLTDEPLGAWHGVFTDASGRVTGLRLYENGLSGSIPSEMSNLTSLEELILWGNTITEISGLSEVVSLRVLWLNYNNIPDISPVAGLTNLTDLSFSDTNIPDPSVLSGLSNLEKLRLIATNTTDLSLLSGLTNLRELTLSHNSVTDISPLAELTNLTYLNFWENQIEDITALSGLTNLTGVGLGLNNVTEISALSGLTKLETLRLNDNNVTDISSLAGLTKLTELYVGTNSITDISALAELKSLLELDLASNNITDIAPLAGLTNLRNLDVRGNVLNDSSIADHVPALEGNGTVVLFDTRLRKGDFDIELVFLDDFTESQKRVLQYTALRWMAVIIEDVPEYEFTGGWSGQCGGQSFEIPSAERIDDLRIYVATGGQPLGIHGTGGIYVMREESHLPVVGCMTFDLSHANLLVTGLHEIGHVLGLLVKYGTSSVSIRTQPNGDEHFNGPLAIAAFDAAGGSDYNGAKVPLRQGESHWRLSVPRGRADVPIRRRDAERDYGAVYGRSRLWRGCHAGRCLYSPSRQRWRVSARIAASQV